MLLTRGKKEMKKKNMEIILSLLLHILTAVYVMPSSHCFPAEEEGGLAWDVSPNKCGQPPVLAVAVCICTEVTSARQFRA